MSPKQIEKWERTRAKGFKRFFWVNGFCGGGVTTGIAWWLSMAFFVRGGPAVLGIAAMLVGAGFLIIYSTILLMRFLEKKSRDKSGSEV